MKELSIEEKAKAYDVALENAKHYHSEMGSDVCCVLEECFSELKESQESEEEKIRKELIQCFSDLEDQENEWYGRLTPKKIVAWLEKQGEQKPADMGKFTPLTVKRAMETSPFMRTGFEDKPTAWSEEDEKIYNRICGLIHSAAYMNYDVDEDGNECGEYANIKGWFNKLKDRVQSQPEQGFKKLKDRIQPQSEQRWSEEDERMYKSITYSFANNYPLTVQQQEFVKSLKGRVQPQTEWSEDDEQYLLVCKNALKKYQTTDKWDANIIFHWLENNLKSLRPQNRWKPSEEKMKALEGIKDYVALTSGYWGQTMTEIIEQLKQL